MSESKIPVDSNTKQFPVDILWRKGQSKKTSIVKMSTPITVERIQREFENYHEEPKTLIRISHHFQNLGHFIAGLPFRIEHKNQDKIKEKSFYLVNVKQNTDIDLWILLSEFSKTKVKENEYHLLTEDEIYTKNLSTQGLRFLYQTKGVKIGFNYKLNTLRETLQQKFSLKDPVMKFQNESRRLIDVIRIIEDKTDEDYQLKSKTGKNDGNVGEKEKEKMSPNSQYYQNRGNKNKGGRIVNKHNSQQENSNNKAKYQNNEHLQSKSKQKENESNKKNKQSETVKGHLESKIQSTRLEQKSKMATAGTKGTRHTNSASGNKKNPEQKEHSGGVDKGTKPKNEKTGAKDPKENKLQDEDLRIVVDPSEIFDEEKKAEHISQKRKEIGQIIEKLQEIEKLYNNMENYLFFQSQVVNRKDTVPGNLARENYDINNPDKDKDLIPREKVQTLEKNQNQIYPRNGNERNEKAYYVPHIDGSLFVHKICFLVDSSLPTFPNLKKHIICKIIQINRILKDSPVSIDFAFINYTSRMIPNAKIFYKNFSSDEWVTKTINKKQHFNLCDAIQMTKDSSWQNGKLTTILHFCETGHINVSLTKKCLGDLKVLRKKNIRYYIIELSDKKMEKEKENVDEKENENEIENEKEKEDEIEKEKKNKNENEKENEDKKEKKKKKENENENEIEKEDEIENEKKNANVKEKEKEKKRKKKNENANENETNFFGIEKIFNHGKRSPIHYRNYYGNNNKSNSGMNNNNKECDQKKKGKKKENNETGTEDNINKNQELNNQNLNKNDELFNNLFTGLWDEIFEYVSDKIDPNHIHNNNDSNQIPTVKFDKIFKKNKIFERAYDYYTHHYCDIFHDLNHINTLKPIYRFERASCFYYQYDEQKNKANSLKYKKREIKVGILPYCYQRTKTHDVFLLQLDNGKQLIAKINVAYKNLSMKEQLNRYKAEIGNYAMVIKYSQEWNNLHSQYSIDYLNRMIIQFNDLKSPHYNYILITEPFKEDGGTLVEYGWLSQKARKRGEYKEKMAELNAFEHYAFARSNKSMIIKTKKGYHLTSHYKGGIYSPPRIITKDHFEKQKKNNNNNNNNQKKKNKKNIKTFEQLFKSKHKCNHLCKKLKLSKHQTDLKKIKINNFNDDEKKLTNRYSICNNVFCANTVVLTLKQYSQSTNFVCYNCKHL
ncbi:transcription initiation factor tfiid subunit [Anaeramoeba flamelloides]|uniref:Transcription initiation factor tfiid subunit n=1 Tax=Anaeramoeba flamelloides TaxID=1746091 RepID=A0AAV8ADZ6_9EUKA|nr:transcription initiation factor tfiid subunit [Anaeramoeba flamelloides]